MPIPGRYEMNDAVPVLQDLHFSKISMIIADCCQQFTVIMDSTPVFPEAECVVICFVHKITNKIVEFVVHLGLYQEPLDGNTFVWHVAMAIHLFDMLLSFFLTGSQQSLSLDNWRATSIDHAATNNWAMSILEKDQGITLYWACCISHGTAGCGKNANMTVGSAAVKYLSAMVNHSLCKLWNTVWKFSS